jgi:galactokinase
VKNRKPLPDLDAGRRRRLAVELRETFPDDADSSRAAIEFARAPGRVNLMGDHTDYNDGFVLPAAIGLETWIAFRRRHDRLVRIASLGANEAGSFWIDELADGAVTTPGAGTARGSAFADLPGRPRARRWLDHVAGTAWSLREANLPIAGFDGVIDSTIPRGAGLASAAALGLVSALAMLVGEVPVAAPWLAALAQRGEREYAGVECELADHFAGAAGRPGRAILLDCRSLDSRYVTMPEGLSVVVCDTGAPLEGRLAAIAERRAECGRAVALIAELEPGIASLRDLDMATLRARRHELPEKLARRAEHVVTENQRVGATAGALAGADLESLGRIFAASHESLRRLFEASVPALDAMVEIATAVPGVVAARMTGAGFGGCTVNLVRDDAVAALKRAVAAEYPGRTGLTPHVYAVSAVEGAGLM